MSNKKESKNEQKQYPSTDLLLNLCINEYQKETQNIWHFGNFCVKGNPNR